MKRVCIPRSLSVSRELTVPCQYTEFQKQSVKINMEEKYMKRACLRLTVVCETKWDETKWNETKWDETKWKSVVCEMESCSLRNENL